MRGIVIFDVNYGPGSFLGHSQKWCVNLSDRRFHVESWIRKGILVSDTPRKIIVTPCDGSCLKKNIPDEISEMVSEILDRI